MTDSIQSLLAYLDASMTPFHAVAESARRLRAAGFRELKEHEAWQIEAGARAYAIRGDTSLVAFVCGQKAPHESGFLAIGAHTDSPNLRVKPHPDVTRSGYLQLGVEVYGGALLSTWLDRDLSLAGRVIVEGERAKNARRVLIDFARPILRIPNLAIHLNRNVNSEGLVLNPQAHLAPILSLAGGQPRALRELLAEELAKLGCACAPDQVLSWDLCLYDVQRATRAGLESEFIQAARLDNLASCFGALSALCAAPAQHDQTRVIVLYDHEEVGSRSAQGACSPFLRQSLERITAAHGGGDGAPSSHAERFARAMAQSFLISADMAHAVHPNYADRHEPEHAPVLGRGPVVKRNANQSYATDGASAARLAQLGRRAEITLQEYVVRSDLPCGSTIGPITAAELGLATVDIGSPLLSMHSVREMAACADVNTLARLLDSFFA
jgi:aspartyl aminopeptidase